MILNTVDETRPGHIARRLAAPFTKRRIALPLEEEALADDGGQFLRRAGIVGEVALALGLHQRPYDVMEVVSPDGVEAETACVGGLHVARIVLVRLSNQDGPRGRATPRGERVGDLGQDMAR